jgi:hypothetical protein
MLEKPAKRPWRPAPKIVTTQTAKLFPSALMLFRVPREPQAALARDGFCYHPSDPTRLPSAAWAAANRAIGKRNGEQDT